MSFNYWPAFAGSIPTGTTPVSVTPAPDPLPVDDPVVGNGQTKVKNGTRSGNTTKYATVSGTLTAGQLAVWDASGNLISSAAPYDIVCSLAGLPTASQVVLIFTAVRGVSLAANFSGSRGSAGVNPTATATYTIKNGSTTIGTVAVSTSGVFTFTTTSGTAKTLVAGDRLTVVAPSSADATLADVGFTLAGTR